MNKKAVEGYLMARNFMLCYKAENTPKEVMQLIKESEADISDICNN